MTQDYYYLLIADIIGAIFVISGFLTIIILNNLSTDQIRKVEFLGYFPEKFGWGLFFTGYILVFVSNLLYSRW